MGGRADKWDVRAHPTSSALPANKVGCQLTKYMSFFWVPLVGTPLLQGDDSGLKFRLVDFDGRVQPCNVARLSCQFCQNSGCPGSIE